MKNENEIQRNGNSVLMALRLHICPANNQVVASHLKWGDREAELDNEQSKNNPVLLQLTAYEQYKNNPVSVQLAAHKQTFSSAFFTSKIWFWQNVFSRLIIFRSST